MRYGSCLDGQGVRGRLRRRRRADGNQRLGVSRTAIAVQEIVDIGTGALERPFPRRDVNFQLSRSLRGLRSLINLYPHASPVREHLALAIKCATAGAIPQILWTRHGADVFCVAEHAIAASLAAKQRLLE